MGDDVIFVLIDIKWGVGGSVFFLSYFFWKNEEQRRNASGSRSINFTVAENMGLAKTIFCENIMTNMRKLNGSV